ncbi:alpha-2,8-sialyltransferase 8F-like [Centropristis striata]|uniref:alpha-2,8-sialyltransferase 8F-like n=1 Tax=Centropristis striata TaxID=184440 RepID=UPI0027E12C8D|nr:alpha-2,8-sialyltransferase 8F-like [Centropristis striata]
MRPLHYLAFTFLCVGSLLITLVWSMVHSVNKPYRMPRHKKSPSELCKGCKEVIDEVKERYSQNWKKQEDNYTKFRSELSSKCNGLEKAIITQANTPVGSKIVYDGEKTRSLKVTPGIFSNFPKEHPLPNKTWDMCAVVGNGGILTDSGCGKMIDSAQFVIRCNLPPLEDDYGKDVGTRTDLVTANPSILTNKYGALQGHRRPFVEKLRIYGDSLLLLPAFSYGHVTSVCQRAVYSIEDFESPIRPVFLNPDYLQKLSVFWRSKGVKALRLSTGIMMTSLALELCANVHLYGFWPFSNHPQGLYALTNHYYDDVTFKAGVHTMSEEFNLLLQLHSQGVLRLHLEDFIKELPVQILLSMAHTPTEDTWTALKLETGRGKPLDCGQVSLGAPVMWRCIIWLTG